MRIGINVPDELLRQVKEIRPEVNVSQVCREALEHIVDVAQKAVGQAMSDNVEQHVGRLAQSGASTLLEPDWVAYALEDAREWVAKLTPDYWERIIDELDFRREDGREEDFAVRQGNPSEGTKGFRDRMSENQEWFLSQYPTRFQSGIEVNPLEKAEKEYARAWLGYVYEVRRLIEKNQKDEYDAEYERVMTERAAYRQGLPGPEVPSQLK